MIRPAIRGARTGALLMLAAALPASAATVPAPGPVPVSVDHHVHIDSPEIAEYLVGYCARPEAKDLCEDLTPHSVDDLLRDMDAMGIASARLLSTGYLVESQFMVPYIANHEGILRAANAFTVDLARQYPDRLQAYIAVNPTSPTALRELAYWKGDPAVSGLKLHLANSGFDFHDPEQVRQLAEVFGVAAANHLSIVVHMRNKEKYGADEASIFLKDILPAAKGAPVQIAHLGGWQGIDPPALAALGRFAEAIEEDPAVYENLTFDLAAVRPDKETPERRAALVELMRRIGMRHFVTASDWPVERDLRSFYTAMRALPLTEEEFREMAGQPDAR